MSQVQPRLCKCCNKEYEVRYSHTIKSGNMIYVDDKGRFWKGKVCPDCQNKRRTEQRKRLKVERSG